MIKIPARFPNGGHIQFRCVNCGFRHDKNSDAILRTDRFNMIGPDGKIFCMNTFEYVCKDVDACKTRYETMEDL